MQQILKPITYNAELEVKNSSTETVFVTKTFDVILKEKIQASGSDGYIGNASLYLTNSSFQNIVDANGSNNSSVGGTDGAGKLSSIDYSSYSNINLNDTSIKYYLSLEGGTDIATGLSNNFIMYKHVTNTNPFIVSYLTTLDAYIQESDNSNVNSLSVKTMFGLSESTNIETYDPIGTLTANTSGQVTSAETAYKENTYISILINELLIAGKSQTLIMDTVLNQYVNHNASTFSDTLFLESVVDTIYPIPNEQTNFKINIGILFATMDSLITNDQYSGSTLASEITKIKASVDGLNLFSELDQSAINAQIAAAVIGILVQPVFTTDPTVVNVETNTTTLTRVISYSSEIEPTNTSLVLPTYYDSYPTALTMTNNYVSATNTGTLTITYNNSSNAFLQRLISENTMNVEDKITVELSVSSSVKIETEFTIAIAQSNREPNLVSAYSNGDKITFSGLANIDVSQSIDVYDYFEDLDNDPLVWYKDNASTNAPLLVIDFADNYSSWTAENVSDYVIKYSKNLYGYDGKVNSTQFITLDVLLEQPLTNPVITGLPSSQTLYVDEITNISMSVIKPNIIFVVDDNNIQLYNGNQLSFKNTAERFIGQHNVTINAKNTASRIMETSSTSISFVCLPRVVKNTTWNGIVKFCKIRS